MFRFLAYNNAIPIGISIVLLGGGAAFAASPEIAATVGQGVLSSQTTVVSIDNTYLVNKDLDAYTPRVIIRNVTEDADTYYVDYELSTIGVEDSVWRDVVRHETLKVAKSQLGAGDDLGVYSTVQLKQVIDHEIALLKETREIEKKTVTNKVVATVYGGLIGKLLDDTTESLPGYMPVVTPVPQSGQAAVGNGTEPSGQPTLAGAASPTSASAPIPAGGILQVLGMNPATVPLRSGYADLGVVITDPSKTSLGVHTFLDGVEQPSVQIDTSKAGTYTVTYRLVDGTGVVAEATRMVNVVDPNPQPVPLPATSTQPTTTAPAVASTTP